MFWHQDLTSCLWLLLFDGLWSSWYLGFSLLGILGRSWIHTFHLVLSYFTLIITLFYPTHPTVTHDLIPISIRRRRRSVFDHLGCVVIHLLDFRFNIFHDCRAWQIADLLVMMLSFWQLARWVLIFVCSLHFEHWSSLFYSSVSFVLSTWYHDTWSCLAFPFEIGHLHYMVDEHIPEYNSSYDILHLSLFTSTY